MSNDFLNDLMSKARPIGMEDVPLWAEAKWAGVDYLGFHTGGPLAMM